MQWISLSDDSTETRSLPEENTPQGDEVVAGNERVRLVHRLLDQLPEPQRTVIVLKEFEELKFREIAEILDCPESTIKSRLYGGLSTMKSVLQEQASAAPRPRVCSSSCARTSRISMTALLASLVLSRILIASSNCSSRSATVTPSSRGSIVTSKEPVWVCSRVVTRA